MFNLPTSRTMKTEPGSGAFKSIAAMFGGKPFNPTVTREHRNTKKSDSKTVSGFSAIAALCAGIEYQPEIDEHMFTTVSPKTEKTRFEKVGSQNNQTIKQCSDTLDRCLAKWEAVINPSPTTNNQTEIEQLKAKIAKLEADNPTLTARQEREHHYKSEANKIRRNDSANRNNFEKITKTGSGIGTRLGFGQKPLW